MIRVLHVIGAMDRAGAETLIMNIYRLLDRDKIQFDFLVHEQRKCDFDEEIEDLGGNIYRLPRYKVFNGVTYRRLCAQHFTNHPEHKIIHGHIGSCASIYLHEAKKQGRFTIVHSHCVCGLGLEGLAFKALSRSAKNFADYFFACSFDAGIDRFGRDVVEGDNFSIVNNGIDAKKFTFNINGRSNVRAMLGIDENSFVVCHVGRLTKSKNHKFLLDVFNQIHIKKPESILLLVGRGELKNKIEQQVKDLGLDSSVRFLGVRDDMYAILSASDAFVFPSTVEGLGIAAIEAQANGLPTFISEEIPQEAVVSDFAKRISLNEDAKYWADRVLESALPINIENRKDGALQVCQAGFDITQVAQNLSDFYLNKV